MGGWFAVLAVAAVTVDSAVVDAGESCIAQLREACSVHKLNQVTNDAETDVKKAVFLQCLLCARQHRCRGERAEQVNSYCHEVSESAAESQRAAEKASKALAQGDGEAALAAFAAAFRTHDASAKREDSNLLRSLDGGRNVHATGAAPLPNLPWQGEGEDDKKQQDEEEKKAEGEDSYTAWYEGPLVIPVFATLSLLFGSFVGHIGSGSGGGGGSKRRGKRQKYSSISQRHSRI